METREKIINSEDIFDGKVIKVKKYTVELPDGSISFREEVLHGGGAGAIVYDNGYIYLVSQFRLAANAELWEIPAGKLEKGEDAESTIKRELVEEIGVKANALKKIAAVYPSPGYTSEVLHVYYCDDFEKVPQKLDKGEFLNVKKVAVKEAFDMLDSGEIKDGKTVIALLYLKNILNL